MSIEEICAVCVDTRDVNLAMVAMERMRAAGFTNILFFTNQEGIYNVNHNKEQIKTIIIPQLRSIEDYSKFVITRLPEYLQVKYFIIFQWDGFCLDPTLWWDGFLEYDYIGAPWLEPHRHGKGSVGNGGFSLRSKNLADALIKTRENEINLPEDAYIALQADILSLDHGLKIAPLEIAKHFSVEHQTYSSDSEYAQDIPKTGTFGFHGWFNFHLCFDDDELISYIHNVMTPAQRSRILGSWENTALLVNLSRAGRYDALGEVAKSTQSALGINLDMSAPHFIQNLINIINDGKKGS